MKSKIKSAIKYFTAALGMVMPYVALAQNRVEGGLHEVGGLFPQTGLASAESPEELIRFVISLALFFAGAVAVLFVIIGGYFYITAGGNEEQSEKGKKTLINAIIGIIVIIMAYVIINVIVNLVA